MWVWNMLRDGVTSTAKMTKDYGSAAINKGAEMLKGTGIQNASLSSVWNNPIHYIKQPSNNNPSTTKYKECKDKNGKGGWDEHGTWTCLFPGDKKPPTWYADYSDFLEARDLKYRNQQLEKAGTSKPKLVAPEDAVGKKVVGCQVSSETGTDAKGNPVKERVVTTYYDDGTASKASSNRGGWMWK